MAPSLWDLLERYMDVEGISTAELARRCGIAESQFSPGKSIRRGNTASLSPDTLRALHRGTGYSLVDLIVAAGMWTREELEAPPALDLGALSNADRLALVAERMRPDDEFGTDPDDAERQDDTARGYSSSAGRGAFPGKSSRGRRATGRSRPRAVPDRSDDNAGAST